ncbi:hypothetical protein ACFE04_002856 [Oxalis oulophora]
MMDREVSEGLRRWWEAVGETAAILWGGERRWRWVGVVVEVEYGEKQSIDERRRQVQWVQADKKDSGGCMEARRVWFGLVVWFREVERMDMSGGEGFEERERAEL